MLGRFTTRKVADTEVPAMAAEMDPSSFLNELPAIPAPDTSPEAAGNPLLSAKLLDAKVRLCPGGDRLFLQQFRSSPL